MLYYDSFYTIGKTHQVCEDYAIQGNKPRPFIVLCDGCSSSQDTDVGARILALATKHIIENAPQWPLEYFELGKQLILNAWEVADKLSLNSNVLDATVMLAFLHENNIHAYIYGDGTLLFKDSAGHIGTIDISFIHNAPFYLSYWPDKARQEEYGRYETYPLILTDSVNGQSKPLPFQAPLVFQFPLEKFPVVAIASDGVTQFIDTLQTIKIPLDEIATHLLDFKSLEGEFVKRRLKRVLEKYARQGIFPADDLSMGVFVNSNGD